MIVDARRAFPYVKEGEILYSNLQNDVRVGDVLLVTSREETDLGTIFYVMKDGIHSPVHSFFARRYVGDEKCSG